MISSLYFSMGFIMLVTARQPERHKAFVDFIILGNTLHALVMAILAQTPFQFLLDVIPIGAMGLRPVLFYPWGVRQFLFGTGDWPRSDI